MSVVLFSVGLDIFKINCWGRGKINKNKFWASYEASDEGGDKTGSFRPAAQGPVRRLGV